MHRKLQSYKGVVSSGDAEGWASGSESGTQAGKEPGCRHRLLPKAKGGLRASRWSQDLGEQCPGKPVPGRGPRPREGPSPTLQGQDLTALALQDVRIVRPRACCVTLRFPSVGGRFISFPLCASPRMMGVEGRRGTICHFSFWVFGRRESSSERLSHRDPI